MFGVKIEQRASQKVLLSLSTTERDIFDLHLDEIIKKYLTMVANDDYETGLEREIPVLIITVSEHTVMVKYDKKEVHLLDAKSKDLYGDLSKEMRTVTQITARIHEELGINPILKGDV